MDDNADGRQKRTSGLRGLPKLFSRMSQKVRSTSGGLPSVPCHGHRDSVFNDCLRSATLCTLRGRAARARRTRSW